MGLLIYAGANVLALAVAVLFKIPITEVYAFLAFNISIMTIFGLINLVSLLKSISKEAKENNDDNVREIR